MKIDSTITISILLAICALFAPSITALINNRHQYKIRKLELQYDFISHHSDLIYQNKYSVYKSFLEEASKYTLFNDYAKNFTSVLASAQAALLLCDIDTKTFLMQYIKGMENHLFKNRHEYVVLLNNIADSFNRELSSLLSEYND